MVKGNVIKALTGASFLLVQIALLVFLYAQSFTPSGIFPKDTDLWNKILTGYLVIFTIAMVGAIAIVPEVVRSLATASYWKSFILKFIPTAIVTTIIFILIKTIFKGPGSINPFNAIAYMSTIVVIIHAIVIVQVEEILFGGLFYTAIQKRYSNTTANISTIIGFSLFHFAKTGGNILVMLTYAPLRYIFNYTRNNGIPGFRSIPGIGEKWFGPSPNTQQTNSGVHFGWNAFVLGFLQPTSI